MRIAPIITAIATTQLGLVAHRQLVEHQVPTSTIQAATASGRLRPLERGVSLVPGAPITPDVRLLAKVLSAGPGAVLSHGSAAWRWGLVDEPPSTPEVAVPRGRRPRTPGLIVHESTDLHLVVAGTIDGLPITDVGRTILDCADERDVELMVDAARRKHQISRSLLPWVVAEHARRGRPGIEPLRHHLALDELPHSDFERLVCRWLRHHGIGGWRLHHHLVLPEFGPVEPDITWAAHRVALELEGADHRDRQTVHDADTARQNALLLAGWDVMRLTYRRWLRQPDRVLREIRAALLQPEPATSKPVRAELTSPEDDR